MIRVFLGPRLIRSARKLSVETQQQANTAIASVLEHFGDPHRHSGLGLRKLAPGLWELRVDIQLRIILVQEGDRLNAYDIMDHDEVRAWLKRNR